MADALSRKSLHVLAMMVRELELIESFRDLNLGVELHKDCMNLGNITVTSDFMKLIKEKQATDPRLVELRELINRSSFGRVKRVVFQKVMRLRR